ncbi:histidine kinase/DNA gyrase B/HSP90-like ATPase [Isoptericola sp. CG 20/1183]|uniref:histidine kinase n=1 Tax=Isoptericola halotolerans TaxID=300560 RepID=A0ABX5EGF2_9MICO|nr:MULTISPECIES: histidine kinase [Isoptericola]PRZ06516.1 histidine kinase/DNA gyrase B/HSP90-like ATPase [Isoptericola halotolerans]PRZ06678.1 histidine kinase/DNA gyrase B/HSP90-like ATPase [Isoptericola sp. CG 20/1183]
MGWSARVSTWFERHRFIVDATGTAFFALFVAGTAAAWDGSGTRTVPVTLWSLATIAPLAWRRTHPVASAVAVYAVALAHLLTGHPLLLPGDIAVLAALWAVTVYGPGWAHVTAIISTIVGSFLIGPVVALQAQSTALLSQLVGVSMFCAVIGLAVWALALVRRQRRVTLDALRDRAERLELERDQQTQIATAAERARIAREMHDIVAHSLSIIVAQADGGRYAAANDPGAAVRSLGVISETGRAALADMRRLLGVLREDDGASGPSAAWQEGGGVTAGHGTRPTAPGQARRADGSATGDGAARAGDASAAPVLPGRGTSSGTAPLAPQPDDADLTTLVAQARDAGTRVSLVRVGVARRLPPGAGLTLHRVTQEALSNVRKHAGPDPRVTVVLRWEAESVTVEVSDDGRGAAAGDGEAGYGLLGMRERAAMFGGSVTAGPRPGGGWRVRFTMPVPAATPPTTSASAGPAASPAPPERLGTPDDKEPA